MIKVFLMFVFLVLSFQIQAQSKEVLEKYITYTLSYHHINYKEATGESQITIYKIEFKNCVMSYSIFKKNKNKTEHFTVRILLSGISKIAMTKSIEGYYIISFSTSGKSIIKEYPNGRLVHEKMQFIPLEAEDFKGFESLKKLQKLCLK